MADIAAYVKEVVEAIRAAAPMTDVPLAVQKPPVGKGARRPGGRTKKAKVAVTPPTAPPEVGRGIADLACPVCKHGRVIVGKRGWGCSRWREGCKFVVWFEADGKKRSEADLRAIVREGPNAVSG